MPINVTSALTPAEAVPATTGRSLVPLLPPADHEPCYRNSRPSAVFLAHLIGTAQGAPQSRARRRIGPTDACAAYAPAAQRRASIFENTF